METVDHSPERNSAAELNKLAPTQAKLMYSKREAAELLSLSIRTLEYLIAGKELVSRKVGKRVLIPHQSLLQFTRQNHETGRPQ